MTLLRGELGSILLQKGPIYLRAQLATEYRLKIPNIRSKGYRVRCGMFYSHAAVHISSDSKQYSTAK